jgi:hypothetical protein
MGSKTYISLKMTRGKDLDISMTDASNTVLPLIKSVFEKEIGYE